MVTIRHFAFAALGLLAIGLAPAHSAVVTTEVGLDGLFVGGGGLTGDFGVTWDTSGPALAQFPIKNNPFSLTAGAGPAQDGTSLTGYTYQFPVASLGLNAAGTVLIARYPPLSTGPARQNVLRITFDHNLLDLVDGSIATDPFTIQTYAFPPGQTGVPISGECESPASSPVCTLSSSRFLESGVASVVPEPSTWAMMLMGFAGLGFAGYRRARRVRTLAA